MNNPLRFLPFYPVFFLIYMAVKNKGVAFGKMPVFFLFLFRYFLLEPLRWLEILFFERSIRKEKLEVDPIFIVGHWRSGTTRLQQLLSLDENHTTTTVYRFLFMDNFIISERWFKKPLNWICKQLKIPYSFQRIPMDLDLPGELESAMSSICSPYSYTWGHLFPKKYEYWINKMIGLARTKDEEGWLNDYDYLIKKLSYASNGKRVVIKSPGDVGRILSLKQRFPKAKFVYIERDPIEVYHSTKYFWKVIRKEISFQKISDEQVHRYILESYSKLISYYNEAKGAFEESQLLEITFEEMNENPMEIVKSIYENFNVKDFPEQKILELLNKKTNHKLGEYETFSELSEELKDTWKGVATFR